MKEKSVEKHLIEEIAKLGGMCLKWTSPGTAGVPDRICILPHGEVAFFEVKAPGKKTKPLQDEFLAQLERREHQVWVVDSVEAVNFAVSCIRALLYDLRVDH